MIISKNSSTNNSFLQDLINTYFALKMKKLLCPQKYLVMCLKFIIFIYFFHVAMVFSGMLEWQIWLALTLRGNLFIFVRTFISFLPTIFCWELWVHAAILNMRMLWYLSTYKSGFFFYVFFRGVRGKRGS